MQSFSISLPNKSMRSDTNMSSSVGLCIIVKFKNPAFTTLMQHLDSLLAYNSILVVCSGGTSGCNGNRGSTNTGVRIVTFVIRGNTDGSNGFCGSYEPAGT